MVYSTGFFSIPLRPGDIRVAYMHDIVVMPDGSYELQLPGRAPSTYPSEQRAKQRVAAILKSPEAWKLARTIAPIMHRNAPIAHLN